MDFSFSSIVTALQDRLTLQASWQRSIFYAVYSYIIRAIAYVLERLAYQSDVYMSESNWFSSSIREFLVRQSFMLSYTPSRNVAPVGVVWTSFDEDELTSAKTDDIQLDTPLLSHSTYTGSNIIFERWTEVTGSNSTTAFVYEETTYYNGTVGPISLPVKVGIPVEFTYISNGSVNEIIKLASESIDNDEIEIDIVDSGGAVLHSVNILNRGQLFFEQTDSTAYYVEVYNEDNFKSVLIKSGDGVVNQKFTANDIIRIKYATTNGVDDDITNTGVINAFADPVTDVSGVVVEMFVINNEAISDGTNIENIESIRNNAPNLFNTGYRLGSDDDWETVLTNQSVIQKAIVWSLEDLGESSITNVQKDTVFGTAISTDGTALTASQKESILQGVLKDDKAVSERFEWEDFEEIYAVFKIDANVTNQPEATIQGLVNDKLEENYGILNVDFQTNIYESNFSRIIDSIDYVLYHTTEIYYMEKELSETEINYQLKTISAIGDAEDQVLLSEDETLIVIRRKIANVWQTPIIVGKDVSATFVGQNGYTISGSALNYSAGLISFSIDDIVGDPSTYGVLDPSDTDPLGYVVSVQYKTRDGNSEVTNDVRLNEIFQITNVDADFNTFELTYP